MQAKDDAAPRKTSTSISVRCFTFPTAPLIVVSAREIEARRGGMEEKRRAALEEEGSPRHQDGESIVQEMPKCIEYPLAC